MADRYTGSTREYNDRAKASTATARSDAAVAKGKVSSGGLGAAAGEKGSNDDPEPKAKDFASLGEWSTARNAWKQKRAANPQSTAIQSMKSKSAAAQ